MSKLSFKKKKTLARRMMTRREIIEKVSPWNSAWWQARKAKHE